MNLLTPTQSLRDRPWLGCAAGVAAVAFSYAVRVALGPAAEGFPFVIFLLPVVLVTFCCGTGAGIFTAVLAGLVADLTLIAEPGHIVPPWPVGWLALGFYAITVGIDIALIHAMTLAFQRAARAEADLRRANEQLEVRVGERTAELRRQIVDREAAEAQVRQMQKMETIGQLTGGIAHDFNNMLAVVIGSIEMARRRLADQQRLAASLDSAHEGATRASALVTRLLAFARQQALAPRIVDVDDLVAKMSNLMRRTLGETIEVAIEPAQDVWRCFVDPGQLENAILNLAVNARDAMPGGGKVTITTANVDLDEAAARTHAEATPGRYVAISVGDTGTGMPPEVLERAFDPFFTTKEVGKGTGLGLSQIYGFVRQSGGHVAIDSEVGRGTTVRLLLPRNVSTEDDIQTPEPASAEETPTARASETVLVVEDEPGVRLMSIDALRELGYTVVQAEDARDALRLIEHEPQIDLLFTDIVMPGMDGRELASAARAMRPDIKVIYTTGYARITSNDGAAIDADTLPKPFTLSALATTVRAALDRPPSA